MAKNRTVATAKPVEDFIDGVSDRQKRQDCLDMIDLMREITGHEPKMWGSSLVGFGSYHYRYESGRDSVARMREKYPSS